MKPELARQARAALVLDSADLAFAATAAAGTRLGGSTTLSDLLCQPAER